MWASEVLSNLLIHYNAIMRLSSLKLGITTQQSLNLIAIPYDGIPMSLLAKKMGYESYILYLIQREGCKSFKVAGDIDKEYKNALNDDQDLEIT